MTILESILTLLLLAVHFIIISILAACVLKNSVFQMFWLEHDCSFHKLYVLKMISHEIFLLLILKMLWLYKKIFIIVINRSIAFSRTLKFSPTPWRNIRVSDARLVAQIWSLGWHFLGTHTSLMTKPLCETCTTMCEWFFDGCKSLPNDCAMKLFQIFKFQHSKTKNYYGA